MSLSVTLITSMNIIQLSAMNLKALACVALSAGCRQSVRDWCLTSRLEPVDDLQRSRWPGKERQLAGFVLIGSLVI
jgi:hypothetical protein